MRARLLLFVVCLSACGQTCGRTAGRDAGAARAAVALPSTALASVASDDPKRFLDGLRGQFRDASNAALVPADTGDVVAGIAVLPPEVRRHIAANAPIRSLYIDEDGTARRVIAVRATLERVAAHPLGVDVALVDGGPDGSKWVGGRPSGSDAAIALFGSVLVVGETERSVREAGRYLAEKAFADPAVEGVSVHVYAAAFDGALRSTIDSLLNEQATAAIASARAERDRHAEGAFFGEPDRLVEALRDRARRFIAYLPDLSGLELRIVANANGVSISGGGTVEPRSPLARALASMGVGTPFGFESLPNSTALAIATRRTSGETPLVELLAPIAGSRLVPADRAAFEGASERLATMRGDASVLAIGGHADGAFALFAAEPGATPVDAAPLDSIVRTAYVRSLLGGIVGCEEVATPSLASGRAKLCRVPAGPEPTIELERGPNANAVVLAARPVGATERHAATHPIADASARVASHGLFADPDSERALAALGDRTFLAVALSARGVVPSLGLLGSARIRSLAASRSLPSSAAPIVFGLSREENGSLGITLVAAPRAIEEVYSLVMLATVLASGE